MKKLSDEELDNVSGGGGLCVPDNIDYRTVKIVYRKPDGKEGNEYRQVQWPKEEGEAGCEKACKEWCSKNGYTYVKHSYAGVGV